MSAVVKEQSSASDFNDANSPRTSKSKKSVDRPQPLLNFGIKLVEKGIVPDFVIRAGIRRLVKAGLSERDGQAERQRDAMIAALKNSPIAIATDEANAQHYEVPAKFYQLALGPQRKYSGCYWPDGTECLAEAESASLSQVCARAGLADGQRILELGCGWGSLSLRMAKTYPNAQIVAVSNSSSQRAFIERECEQRDIRNLQIITADMNDFAPDGTFDRIVSIEMFEHMRNYELLLRRVASWLAPDGQLFIHVFAHRETPYLFESRGPADWMSIYFFTGGVMPSFDLYDEFSEDLTIVERWWQDGTHYEKTANAWLKNMDDKIDEVRALFEHTYDAGEAPMWIQRWRVFFMACAEMFGYRDGSEWGVAHFVFQRKKADGN